MKGFWKKEYLFQIIIFLLIIGFVILILLFPEKIKELGRYGYLGAFLISMFSNATILIPAPGWIAISALALTFNPWLIGFLAGLGAAIGQTTGYFLGYSGRFIMMKDVPTYQKMADWMQRNGCLAIFLFIVIPLVYSILWRYIVKYLNSLVGLKEW